MKLVYKEKVDKLFFTSDTHFFHANIIKYCNRPFESVEDQNEQLIDNWNRIVPKDGTVIVAGDFIQSSSIDNLKYLINQLNGTIHLVMGNHDYQNRLDRTIIKEIFNNRVYDVLNLKIPDGEEFFISHYPHMYWPRNTYHLHGHVHSGPKSASSELVPFHYKRYDIGVDNNDYQPISYNDLMVRFDDYLVLTIN